MSLFSFFVFSFDKFYGIGVLDKFELFLIPIILIMYILFLSYNYQYV